MTREQAIEEISKAFELAFANYIITALTEGTTVSDKSLEQQPSDDCVSRQAVLDCLTATGLKKFDFILDAREKVNNLSSVTPTHGTCKDCKHNRPNSYARTMFSCERGNRFKLRDCEDFYCADFEKRGSEK